MHINEDGSINPYGLALIGLVEWIIGVLMGVVMWS